MKNLRINYMEFMPEILESFLMKPWISGRPVTKFASLLDSFDAGELIFNKQSKSETDKKQ